VSHAKEIPPGVNKSDSLRDRIRVAIDSADRVEAALILARSTGGQTPIVAVASYCDGEGFLRDYYEYLKVEDRSGRFYIYMNHFDALKEVYEKAVGRCSRRKLKNVSKKYKNQHKKEPSYSDGDITVVRAKSKDRLSDALYYRRVFFREHGKPDIHFPLKGEVLSECFKQAKQIRSAYDDFGYSLVDLLRKFHPESKRLRKLGNIQRAEAGEFIRSGEPSKRISLAGAIEDYLETKRDNSKHTHRQAKAILTRFKKYIGEGKLLDEITKQDATEYLAEIPPKGSYNHHYRAVNGLFRWAINEESIDANPCARLKLKKFKRKKVEVLSCLECIALLLAAEELYDGELLAYVALIIFAAVRPDSEATHLSWSDINFEDGEMRISEGKLPDPRMVELPPNLVSWLKLCDRTRPIYPSSYNEFKRKWAAVRRLAGFRGGTKVSHSKYAEVVRQKKAEELARKPWVKDYGRHTAISCRIRQTGDIFTTATWAGTSPEIIRKHYLSIVPTSQAKEFWSIEP
jgi:integrase